MQKLQLQYLDEYEITFCFRSLSHNYSYSAVDFFFFYSISNLYNCIYSVFEPY